LNEVALERLALPPDGRVLEVGFGGGYLLGRMAGIVTDGSLAGVDASPAMVRFCSRRFRPLIAAGKIELKCAKAESLPYPSGGFARACSVNSIFYWEDAPRAFSEMWRVLEANGLLVICFTCRTSLETRGFSRHGLALYDAEDVSRMMEAAGFDEILVTRASDKHREFWCMSGRK
jgi:ubiquinone/menaquinone biosynthesis C-methylase UbiE